MQFFFKLSSNEILIDYIKDFENKGIITFVLLRRYLYDNNNSMENLGQTKQWECKLLTKAIKETWPVVLKHLTVK